MSNWLFQRSRLLIALAVLLAAVAYLPGLRGSYVYDDFSFVVDNPMIHVSTLSADHWAAAADSFPAAHQGRWLGMLSFAANHYVGGLDPFGFKVTNLVIHLINGILLWLFLRALFRLVAVVKPPAARASGQADLAAALIAAFWLILPINLTSVLYVSQRLESLSNTFVLIGLWTFCQLRLKDWRGERTGLRMTIAVLLCTGVGSLVKESAILLPLYIACIELILTQGRRADGRWSKGVLVPATLCLIIPLLVGAIWLTTWIGSESSYSRSFSLPERLMTQARVLLGYIQWILFPNLSHLTLYHDDVEVSRNLLQPWATLPALMTIVALLAVAWQQRLARPLFTLGIFMFFAGHALTSTVIPLMLAFEHRNYFPSIGILLSVSALLMPETGRLQPRVQALGLALVYLFYVGTTHLRALEWSDPLRLAASEAAKRPDSVDAQYDFARALMLASGNDPQSPLTARALDLLVEKRALPGAGLLFDHAIYVIRARRGDAVSDQAWSMLLEGVRRDAPRSTDVSALRAIYDCMREGTCLGQYQLLRELTEAALARPNSQTNVYLFHAVLVFAEFHDLDSALRSIGEAERRSPNDSAVHFYKVSFLIDGGRFDQAHEALDVFRKLQKFGTAGMFIDQLDQKLKEAEAREARPAA